MPIEEKRYAIVPWRLKSDELGSKECGMCAVSCTGNYGEEPSGWSNWNGFHAYNCLMTPACLGIITHGKDGRVAHNGAMVL